MSEQYKDYAVGGHSIAGNRYLFKNSFAGARTRKRLEIWGVIGILLIFVGHGLTFWLSLAVWQLNEFDLIGLIFGELILGVAFLGWLWHAVQARIGTFVCEFSTSTKEGKLERRFKCLDLRGARPETLAMWSYEPKDLELRGDLRPPSKSALPWVEFRLNIPQPPPDWPETIILLGAPTKGHKLSTVRVLEFVEGFLNRQEIELADIRNELVA